MRGSNENMNGLLRQYFPKALGLSVYSVGDLVRGEQLLNTCPRNVLGWSTPATVFTAKLSC